MIRIVTDSAANLPEAFVQAFDIAVVPLKVIIGDHIYRDGVDLSVAEFYEMLQTQNISPSTSQPSPDDFIEVYKPILDAGDEILSIHLAHTLSGTFNSAVQAAQQFPNAPITLVDTYLVSIGTGLAVLGAAQAIRQGANREEAADVATRMSKQTTLLFTLETLEYLRRGGRIGNASAFFGTLLRIKPVLALQHGVVEPVDRVRTRQRALSRMVEMVVEQQSEAPVWLGIAHANAPDEAARVRAELEEKLDVRFCVETVIGPVVGAHAGPGTVGVAVTPAPEGIEPPQL